MILRPGEKIHIVHRPLFNGDSRRHFIGTVVECVGALARVTGYLYAMDVKTNRFARRETLRTRIVALDTNSVFVNLLPDYVNIDNITYQYRPAGDVMVTDGGDWSLDLTSL